jgi:DNA-binding MarR family transcriptional regulator
MNTLSRIQNFPGISTDEFLAFSFAYLGEKLIKDADKNIFRPKKISAVQYNILCTLAVQSPRPASDIAQFILGSAPNFSAILGRMEKEELIEREISKKDRREIFVFLTKKGKKLFTQTRKEFQKFFTDGFKNISKEEKEAVKALLIDIVDKL